MKNNKKGFTLAELLVVVGIIAVLVAIAIPVFTAQLSKAKEATYAANLRAAYAAASVDVLEDEDLDTTTYSYGGNTYTAAYSSGKVTVSATIDSKAYSFDGNTFSGFSNITIG